jgi:hypothetical protein
LSLVPCPLSLIPHILPPLQLISQSCIKAGIREFQHL